MWNNKLKALTFSYDDGVRQDSRLIEIFNKYGLKCTFNLNSELLGKENSLIRDGVEIRHDKVEAKDVRAIYSGHEIAAHTLTHPTLTKVGDDAEIIRQVEEDRIKLSELAGYEVVGFAYPGGGVNFNSQIAELIKNNTGIKYARTTVSTNNFELQSDLFEFKPTAYHHTEFNKLFELGEKFLESNPEKPQLFYVWGHSYEFDIRNEWDRFEEFCKMMSGKNDIFYGTNRDILL